MNKINKLIFFTFISIFILKNFGFSQIVPESSKGYPTGFYFDYSSFRGNEGNSILEFYYQISNNTLIFTKTEDGYSSKYELAVSFTDKKTDKLVEYKTWEEVLSVKNYSETTLRSEYWINQMNFSIPSGEYKMKVVLTDLESDHKNEFSRDIVVKEYERGEKIRISDIELVSSKLEKNVNKRFSKGTNLNLVPNSTNVYGDLLPKLLLYYELYGLPYETDKDKKLSVEYRILNYKNEIILSFFEDIEYDSESTSQFAAIPLADINEGKYYLNVRVRSDKSEKFISTEKRFFIKRSFGPVGDDFEKSIEYLRYIASDEELNKIKSAKDDKKKKLWLEFWEKKDPTKNTQKNEMMEEYYRRIRYANKEYSHIKEGWLTDRGRIYILLGRPDEIAKNYLYGANQEDYRGSGFNDQIVGRNFEETIDNNQYNLHGSKPCIIWYYYSLKKKFVFVDKHGTGDYVLLKQRYDW